MGSYFDKLNTINVNDKVEIKDTGKAKLSYLSWAFAVEKVTELYPDMKYEIEFFNGLPYVFDEKTGYMVFTNVTIEGVTKRMWLPVMDGNNNAMLDKPYTYKTKFGEKKVEAATMFDVNKTIMRCLVKNFGMFGLGLYIYAGEDLPTCEKESNENNTEENTVEYISTEQSKFILSLDKPVIDWVLNKFQVESVTDLTKEQAEAFITTYNNRKKKENK